MRNGSEETEKISAAIPQSLRAGLEQSARANDRSLSAEVRRALAEYLFASDRDDEKEETHS